MTADGQRTNTPTSAPDGTAQLAGRTVARIGFGAMQLEQRAVGPDTALAILRLAVREGINHINTGRVDHIYEDAHEGNSSFFLHYSDLTDASSLATVLAEVEPDEIYNLGAQSHVKVSFEIPEYTSDGVSTGTLRLLEAIRRTGLKSRFYQASSSEMYGSTAPPQSETTV